MNDRFKDVKKVRDFGSILNGGMGDEGDREVTRKVVDKGIGGRGRRGPWGHSSRRGREGKGRRKSRRW